MDCIEKKLVFSCRTAVIFLPCWGSLFISKEVLCSCVTNTIGQYMFNTFKVNVLPLFQQISISVCSVSLLRLHERPSGAEYLRSYDLTSGRDSRFILRQQENTFMANQVRLMRQDGPGQCHSHYSHSLSALW